MVRCGADSLASFYSILEKAKKQNRKAVFATRFRKASAEQGVQN